MQNGTCRLRENKGTQNLGMKKKKKRQNGKAGAWAYICWRNNLDGKTASGDAQRAAWRRRGVGVAHARSASSGIIAQRASRWHRCIALTSAVSPICSALKSCGGRPSHHRRQTTQKCRRHFFAASCEISMETLAAQA